MEKTFEPRVFIDKNEIKLQSERADRIAGSLKTAQKEIETIYGLFNLDLLKTLLNAKGTMTKEIAVMEYVKAKEINSGILDIKAVIKQNLVKIPKLDDLLKNIINLKAIINESRAIYDLAGGFKGFFNDDLKSFVYTDEADSVIKLAIEIQNTYQTESQEENDYLQEAEELANLYLKFVERYKVIPRGAQIPGETARIIYYYDGRNEIVIDAKTLNNYRNKKKMSD